MSPLAGIFKFDPRDRVRPEELGALVRPIDRIGPDGGWDVFEFEAGIAYRAFHTTPESHSEIQPYQRPGYCLTWDGRLDNADEIRSRVDLTCSSAPTDVELVAAAYEAWGTGCFAELIGDWAIALRDRRRRCLLLARDSMGARRLFYRVDQDGVSWCTTVEPLIQTAPRILHPDTDYIASCFYPRPPLGTTPYREIHAVLPASVVCFELEGKFSLQQYWSLNSAAKIRYARDADYEEHFRWLFRQAVRRCLRADRPILAELSGGVDSSSIVCMADEIRKHEPGPAVETISYFDTNEPTGDERTFFQLIEQKRQRTGHHVSIAEFNQRMEMDAFVPLPEEHFVAAPGYSAKSLRWWSIVETIQEQVGARVIVSGLGGDELLGGVQYEAPEIAGYLLSGNVMALARSTLRWGVARRKTVYQLLGDAFELLLAAHDPDRFLRTPIRPYPWTRLEPATHHKHLANFTRWRDLEPSQASLEWTRYCIAQQLTETDLPLRGCAERRYPFLDRSLFAYVASIPRTQILQSNHRRHLMRRALRGIVPDAVLLRVSKCFGSRGPAAALADSQVMMRILIDQQWLSGGAWIDLEKLRKHLDAVQHGVLPDGLAVQSAFAVERWLRDQRDRGFLATPLEESGCTAR